MCFGRAMRGDGSGPRFVGRFNNDSFSSSSAVFVSVSPIRAKVLLVCEGEQSIDSSESLASSSEVKSDDVEFTDL